MSGKTITLFLLVVLLFGGWIASGMIDGLNRHQQQLEQQRADIEEWSR